MLQQDARARMLYQCLCTTCYSVANASCWLLLLEVLMIMAQFWCWLLIAMAGWLLIYIFYCSVAVTVMLTLPLLTTLATAFLILVCSLHYHSPPQQHLVPFPMPCNAVSVAPVHTAIFSIAPIDFYLKTILRSLLQLLTLCLMHCCQCHYCVSCCCHLVDCCFLFIQRMSCHTSESSTRQVTYISKSSYGLKTF